MPPTFQALNPTADPRMPLRGAGGCRAAGGHHLLEQVLPLLCQACSRTPLVLASLNAVGGSLVGGQAGLAVPGGAMGGAG